MILLGWVIDGNNGDRGSQQRIVAIAVGGRLELEFQCIGYLQRRDGRRRCRPMQKVHDVRARGDLFIERHSAGLSDSVQAVECDHREHLHELPIAVGVASEPLAQARHGGG
jgi:hypothetical protein